MQWDETEASASSRQFCRLVSPPDHRPVSWDNIGRPPNIGRNSENWELFVLHYRKHGLFVATRVACDRAGQEVSGGSRDLGVVGQERGGETCSKLGGNRHSRTEMENVTDDVCVNILNWCKFAGWKYAILSWNVTRYFSTLVISLIKTSIFAWVSW